MKLEIGKCSYEMKEPIGAILRVTVCDVDGGHGSFMVLMSKVSLADIISFRQKDLSFGSSGRKDMPLHYCLSGDWLEIWPRPDKEYRAVVTYYPPARDL